MGVIMETVVVAMVTAVVVLSISNAHPLDMWLLPRDNTPLLYSLLESVLCRHD